MHLSSARMLTLVQNRQVTESAWVSHILSPAKEPYVHHSKNELMLVLRLHSSEDYTLCLGFVIVPLS